MTSFTMSCLSCGDSVTARSGDGDAKCKCGKLTMRTGKKDPA